MTLHILGSSSSGNCYLFKAKDQTLIVEAGIHHSKVRQALAYDFSKVVGCVITHEHGDHAKYASNLLREGIKLYASKGTLDAIALENHHSTFAMMTNIQYRIGQFIVLPFPVQHDAAEPLGFIIHHPECGYVAFLTDLKYSPYKFPDINNILIEANYCEDKILMLRDAGLLPDFRIRRLLKSHMSIQTCKQFLKANDLSKVNKIVLLHLSDSNSDAERFQKEVYDQTLCETIIADKDTVIELNKTPF